MADKSKRNVVDSEVKDQFKEILERKQRQQRTGPAHGKKLKTRGVSGPAVQNKIFRRKTG